MTNKNIRLSILLALVVGVAACSKNSENHEEAKEATPLSRPTAKNSKLRLADKDYSISKGLGLLSNGQLYAIFSTDNTYSCKDYKNSPTSWPKANLATVTFPFKIADYGSIQVQQMAQYQIVVGFSLSQTMALPATELKLNVLKADNSLAKIQIEALSSDHKNELSGEFDVEICN